MGRVRQAAVLVISLAVIGVAVKTVRGEKPVAPHPPVVAAPAAPAAEPAPEPAPAPAVTSPDPAAAAPEAPALAAPQAEAPAPVSKLPMRDPTRGSVTNLPLPRYVSLKGNEGNARRGPGLTHRIDWVFTRAGMPLRITAEYEHWRRVEDADGAGGWVHYSLLSGVRSALVTAPMAEFRDAPRDDAEVVFRAERNVVGWIKECSGGWCSLSIDHETGWVRQTDLWGVDPGEEVE